MRRSNPWLGPPEFLAGNVFMEGTDMSKKKTPSSCGSSPADDGSKSGGGRSPAKVQAASMNARTSSELLDREGFGRLALRDVAAAIRRRGLTAVELLNHCRRRHRDTEDRLHAYVCWNEDAGLAMAEAADAAARAGSFAGLLHGIPLSVKDVFGVAGMPIRAGSSRALPACFAREGTFIGGLRRQLAVFTGKTRTDEFAYGGLGTVNDGPVPRNPWNAERHCAAGGSSSGAPVSLWQETALVAVASDTSGSVRRPAGLTGTAGLKLTVSRWPADDMLPLCPTMDTPGILARTVADLRFAFYAMDPHLIDPDAAWRTPALDPGDVTIGICGQVFWDDCDPGVAETVKAALDELAGKGVRVVKVDLPQLIDTYDVVERGGIVSSEFMAFMERELPEWLDILQPQLRARLIGPDRPELSAVQYLTNKSELSRCAAAVLEGMQGIDALAAPTLPITAPALEDVAAPDAWQRINKRAVRNTYMASLLGLCALSLPAGLDAARIPVGLQLIAKPWQEERLLAIGCLFERLLGDARQRHGPPPLG